MNNNEQNLKIKINITDPWDSQEIIEGTLYREVFIDNLKSALVHSEKRNGLFYYLDIKDRIF